jgi:nitrogen fixation protein
MVTRAFNQAQSYIPQKIDLEEPVVGPKNLGTDSVVYYALHLDH